MSIKKRLDKNSIEGAIATTKAHSQELVCPVKLNEEEQAIFLRTINSRERSTWVENDLHLAGIYAQTVRMEREVREQIDEQGYTVHNDRGTLVSNPNVLIRQQLVGTIVNLVKALGVSAGQKGLGTVHQAKRNLADDIARKALKKAGEEIDELI